MWGIVDSDTGNVQGSGADMYWWLGCPRQDLGLRVEALRHKDLYESYFRIHFRGG